MTITKFIIGLIILVAGAIVVVKYEWMLQNFGAIDWAENHFSSAGGSRFGYKLLGIILIVVGLFIMFNLHETLIMMVFGPLFGR